MRVDTSDIEQGANRASIRLESTSAYGPGHLFVADIIHMPVGCSVWPAWWSYGQADYPNDGEIDTLEGVNHQAKNEVTFWVSSRAPVCRLHGADCLSDGPRGLQRSEERQRQRD